jgi:general stress protein 26
VIRSNVDGMSDAPAPSVVPISWSELQDIVTAAGDGLFLATADADGLPHVAYVSAGWADERLWISSFASSKKVANLRQRGEAAFTCAPSPEVNLLIRATARLVTDLEETRQLWEEGVLPYDPSAFFSGPEDPQTQFVEFTPTVATIHPLGPGEWKRWTPSSASA